jgi:2-amino-4-hydroxy-6-hydroxymethyldihydropteridine diphosphokinase
MREPVTAYIALGANLGEAAVTLRQAISSLGACPGIHLKQASSLYRTAPMESSGPDYINAVVEVHTALSAPDLLAQLQALELANGRERPYRNAPRTLDLDILLFGDAQLESAALTIPHPRMAGRAFVLVPLAEIAPHRVSEAQLQAVQNQSIERL